MHKYELMNEALGHLLHAEC